MFSPKEKSRALNFNLISQIIFSEKLEIDIVFVNQPNIPKRTKYIVNGGVV